MLSKNLKILLGGMIIALSLSLITGCGANEEKQSADTETQSGEISSDVAGGGIIWSKPSGWETGPVKQMRLVTYLATGGEGDVDSAECAVFYFGATSGGGTEANIARWANQLNQPDGTNSIDKAKTDEFEVEGFKVTTVDVTGSYTVPAGKMMQATANKTDYRLIGAVFEGPQGSVFFKMTGPEKTMAANEDIFMNMIKSIKPQAM